MNLVKRKPITIVTGGQWGSEAKGAIAAYLCGSEMVDYAVRTGATNAGHTVEYKGKFYAMQQVPVGWVYPHVHLVIGAGALVDLAILDREIKMIEQATGEDITGRISIDYRAYIHRSVHAERSAASGRHHGIGATGKGCSEALIDRVRMRGVENGTIAAFVDNGGDSPGLGACIIDDTEKMLNDEIDRGKKVLLEGCQGTMLDLVLGPYPYTTHKQTTPAQWMSEVGLSPALETDIVMVLRSMPIRVAGNSGPMGQETSWPTVARSINSARRTAGLSDIVRPQSIVAFEDAVRDAAAGFDMPIIGGRPSDGLDMHMWSAPDRARFSVPLSEVHKVALATLPADTVADLRNLFEMTTVTKKLRRIAYMADHELVIAARQVRPHRVAVTFLNYIYPEMWHSEAPLTRDERVFLHHISDLANAPVFLTNRGPAANHILSV